MNFNSLKVNAQTLRRLVCMPGFPREIVEGNAREHARTCALLPHPLARFLEFSCWVYIYNLPVDPICTY